jgi:hypothetical protein
MNINKNKVESRDLNLKKGRKVNYPPPISCGKEIYRAYTKYVWHWEI